MVVDTISSPSSLRSEWKNQHNHHHHHACYRSDYQRHHRWRCRRHHHSHHHLYESHLHLHLHDRKISEDPEMFNVSLSGSNFSGKSGFSSALPYAQRPPTPDVERRLVPCFGAFWRSASFNSIQYKPKIWKPSSLNP